MFSYSTWVFKCATTASFIMSIATIVNLQQHRETTKTQFDIIEKIQLNRERDTEEYIDDAIERKMEQLTSHK